MKIQSAGYWTIHTSKKAINRSSKQQFGANQKNRKANEFYKKYRRCQERNNFFHHKRSQVNYSGPLTKNSESTVNEFYKYILPLVRNNSIQYDKHNIINVASELIEIIDKK